MQQRPLWGYVLAVVIIFAALNVLMYLVKGQAIGQKVTIFSAGFLVGMLAMFIAVHIYRWR